MAALPPPPAPTIEAIWAAYERPTKADKGQQNNYRPHLGCSMLGHECERALWYGFHWISQAKHIGRILRLFETGNREEARLIADLRAAGVTVLDRDPSTNRQWNVKAVKGHLAGSMDGAALGLLEAPKTWHALELKTHNARSFADLKQNGVARSKPLHMAQLQLYMHLAGLERGCYLAVCKDTDELWLERVKPDKALVELLLAKAERVIDAPRPPPRISEDPSFYLCRWCEHAPVCHAGELPPRNCRTCLSSTPVDDGKWHCDVWDKQLTYSEQRAGCLSHRYIPDFVAGEQVDVQAGHEGAPEIVYRRPDGSEWTDGEGMP